MRKILITNDDGIHSNGLIRLAQTAKEFGEVWVVAPESERSAMSHTVTLRGSVEVWPVDFPVEGVHAFACSGTPVDCVRIGTLNIVPDKPDHVFSGINFGYNLATDLQYSATVGAAFEAAFQKIHCIAFSEDANKEHSVTDKYLKDIMGELLEKPLEANQIWNVNFPSCKLDACKGILRDRAVSRDDFYKDHYQATPLEDGKIAYQVVGVRSYEAEEGTDLRAIFDNYVSIGVANNIS